VFSLNETIVLEVALFAKRSFCELTISSVNFVPMMFHVPLICLIHVEKGYRRGIPSDVVIFD
jgi:hypothetical protein